VPEHDDRRGPLQHDRNLRAFLNEQGIDYTEGFPFSNEAVATVALADASHLTRPITVPVGVGSGLSPAGVGGRSGVEILCLSNGGCWIFSFFSDAGGAWTITRGGPTLTNIVIPGDMLDQTDKPVVSTCQLGEFTGAIDPNPRFLGFGIFAFAHPVFLNPGDSIAFFHTTAALPIRGWISFQEIP